VNSGFRRRCVNGISNLLGSYAAVGRQFVTDFSGQTIFPSSRDKQFKENILRDLETVRI
jgi:hypothetical protein